MAYMHERARQAKAPNHDPHPFKGQSLWKQPNLNPADPTKMDLPNNMDPMHISMYYKRQHANDQHPPQQPAYSANLLPFQSNNERRNSADATDNLPQSTMARSQRFAGFLPDFEGPKKADAARGSE